jgi:3-dehydroquinate synthase
MLNIVKRFYSDFPSDTFAGLAGDADFRSAAAELVRSHIKYKASIVAGDERESAERTDASSRKILNFGHTLAHALETVTNYTYFKHGEAVGYGILFASGISKNLAICPRKDVELLNDVVHRLGKLPSLAGIDDKEVLEAFRSDKKNLAGSLQMVLLKGIGKPVIVPFEDIPTTAVHRALKELRS